MEKIKLHQIQKEYVSRIITNKPVNDIPTGIGKAVIALEAIRILKLNTLIITPVMLIESVWMREHRKYYAENFSLINLNKKYSLNRVFANHIINPERLIQLAKDTNDFEHFHWDMVIVYCIRLKNGNSKTATVLKKVLSKSKRNIIMSREPEWLMN